MTGQAAFPEATFDASAGLVRTAAPVDLLCGHAPNTVGAPVPVVVVGEQAAGQEDKMKPPAALRLVVQAMAVAGVVTGLAYLALLLVQHLPAA